MNSSPKWLRLLFALQLLILPWAGYSQNRFPPSPNALDENGLRTGHWTLLYDSTWKEVTRPDSAIYYRLIRFDKGKPTGKVRDFYRTGNKQWEGYLTSLNPDVIEGEAIYYHENGKVESIRTLSNGLLNGPSREYTIDGVLFSEGNYKDGMQEGFWKIFFEDGTLRSEVEMHASEIHGLSKRYYQNGQVELVNTKIDGNAQGLWEEYHDNGKLRVRTHYINGIQNGMREAFFSSGTQKEKGLYKEGQKVGRWLEYDSLGQLISDRSFNQQGLAEGTWKMYYANGKLKALGSESAGYQNGWWTFYYDDGTVQSEGELRRNLWEGEWKFYYANGKLKEHSQYLRDTINGFSREYFENGQVSAEGNKTMGRKEGPWKEYNEQGQLVGEASYQLGLEEGKARTFNEDGQVLMIMNYQHGQLQGVAERYHPNGKVSDRMHFVNGSREGSYESFYEDGSPEKVAMYESDSLEGEVRLYYPEGQLAKLLFYHRNEANGKMLSYHSNGKLESETYMMHSKLHGSCKRYFGNGTLKEEGAYSNDLQTGPWLHYDSATGRRIKEVAYDEKGKQNGVAVTYTTSGKVEAREYYIHGFEETRRNLRDSIIQLVDAERYDEAWAATEWLERVVKRDFKEKGDQILPLSMKGQVLSARGDHRGGYKWYEAYRKAVLKYIGPQSTTYGVAAHNAAVALHTLAEYDRAIELYDLAIALAIKDGINESYWSSIMTKVNCLHDAGRGEEATVLLESELIRSDTVDAAQEDKWYLREEAAEYFENREKDEERALRYYKSLLTDIDSSGESSPFVFEAGRRAANILFNQDRWPESIPYYEKAIASAEENALTLRPSYSEAVVNLFYAYDGTQRVDTAAQRQAAVQFAKLTELENMVQSPDILAKIQLARANEFYFRGEYKVAVPLMHKAETNLLAAGKGNTIRHAAILQTMAFGTIYADYSAKQEAEEYFLKSIQIRKDQAGVGSSVYYASVIELAGLYNEAGDYRKAIEVLEKIKPVADSVGDQQALARINKYMAEDYSSLGDYQSSIDHYKLAIEYYEVNPADYANKLDGCYYGLARQYKNSNNYEMAKVFSDKAIKLSAEVWGPRSLQYLDNLGRLATIHSHYDVLSEALRLYQQKLAGLEQVLGRNNDSYITTVTDLADVYISMGDGATATHLLEGVYEVAIQTLTEQSTGFLVVLDGLARATDALKMHSQSERYYLQAYATAKKLFGGNVGAWSLYGYNLSLFYDNRNRLEEAEQLIAEVVNAVAQSDIGNTSLACVYMAQLAFVKQELDKNKEAEEYYVKAYELARQDSVQSHLRYATALRDVGRFYSRMGRYGKAKEFLTHAMAVAERHVGRKQTYVNAGTDLIGVYYNQGLNDSVRNLVGRLMNVLEESSSQWGNQAVTLQNYLGIVADDEGHYAQAKESYEYAIRAYSSRTQLAEFEVSSLATFHSNLARAELSLGNIAACYRNLAETERLRKESHTPQEMKTWAPTEWNWANYYEKAGQIKVADQRWRDLTNSLLRYVNDNFYYMSDEEKAQFWNNYRKYFRAYHSFALTQHKNNSTILGDAYNVQLATKALLLSSANKIRKRILSSGDSAMINMYYRWTQVRERIAQQQVWGAQQVAGQKAHVDSLLTVANALEREMNVTAEDMVVDKGGDRVRWQQVQALLTKDEAAVEIIRVRHYNVSITDSVYYAALILTAETKTSPLVVLFPNGASLEGRSFKWYKNAIGAQWEDTLSYRAYWEPIARQLKTKTTVYVSLDGVYNQINLNTLREPDGRYLVDSKTLVLVSNTRDILSIKSRKIKRFARSTAALFGFPSYFLGKDKLRTERNSQRDIDWAAVSDQDATGIAPLEGTQVEVTSVTDVLRQSKVETRVYTTELAAEDVLKSIQHPRILHVATHGFFIEEGHNSLFANVNTMGDQSNPLMKSGLLLAGAANYLQHQIRWHDENGILTAYEAANLNLDNTDLVVLSACETGKGEVQNGEGVYGLQRAFQTAGAEATVMSLWKVDDAATQLLMTNFYRMWMEGATMGKALQQAQIELKRTHPHPYYWGAFVMMQN